MVPCYAHNYNEHTALTLCRPLSCRVPPLTGDRVLRFAREGARLPLFLQRNYVVVPPHSRALPF